VVGVVVGVAVVMTEDKQDIELLQKCSRIRSHSRCFCQKS
jgi:hypothetical protein